MKSNPTTLSALFGLVLLATTPGHAGETLTLGTATVPNRISGYTGDKKVADAFYGVKQILWEEDNDKPCYLNVQAKKLSSPEGKVAEISICKGNAGNKKIVELTVDNHYLRGIAVCTTDRKDSSDNRLKGIRLYAAEVEPDGKVIALNAFEKNEHTNCAKWHPAVYCPSGHIANAVYAYYKGGNKGGYFTGLGLKCAKVITVSDAARAN